MSPPINIATLGTMLPVPEFLGDIHRPWHSSSYPEFCPLSLAASPGLCPLLFSVPPSLIPHPVTCYSPLQGSVPITCWPPSSVPCHLSHPPHNCHLLLPHPGYALCHLLFPSRALSPVTCCPTPRLCPWLLSPVTGETPGYDLCHLLASPGFCPPLLAVYLRLCPCYLLHP